MAPKEYKEYTDSEVHSASIEHSRNNVTPNIKRRSHGCNLRGAVNGL